MPSVTDQQWEQMSEEEQRDVVDKIIKHAFERRKEIRQKHVHCDFNNHGDSEN